MPFCSSVVVVFALMLLKRAQANGASAWTAMILVSWISAGVFSLLTLFGGTMQSPWMLWQPAIIGALFMTGQFLTFVAVKLGDVSIAAPVQGVKVLVVPAFAFLLFAETTSGTIWLAAGIALVGIVFVQVPDKGVSRSRILWSVLLAFLAAATMSIFDLFIQRWAPAWGAGYFLPLAFAFAAPMSLVFLPLADRPRDLADRAIWVPLVLGSALIAIQAIGMTFTLAQFGDATRVNIVYSMRGVWGVVLSWALSKSMKVSDERPNARVMTMRLIGALLIGVSVWISIVL